MQPAITIIIHRICSDQDYLVSECVSVSVCVVSVCVSV